MKRLSYILLIGLIFILSCGETKKEQPKDNQGIMKEVEIPVNDSNIDAITKNLETEAGPIKGETGFSILLTKKHILLFKKDKDVVDADIDDSVVINIFYFNKEKKQLSFNMIDVLEENFKFNDENYLLAEFDYEYDEDISTIQIGQYSKLEAKMTWNLPLSANLIKK